MFRDRIQKPLYHRQNTGTILNYLEELILINAKEVGLVPISQEFDGYQDIELEFDVVTELEVPEGAVSATMMIETDSVFIDDDPDEDETNSFIKNTKETVSVPQSVASLLMRFKENGSNPTLTSGFGLGNNDIFELVGSDNLSNFRMISIQEKNTVRVRVQFYKSAQ